MTRIAILGANGRVSHAASRAFHAAGYEVIAVTRNGRAEGLPADVKQRAADAMDRQSLIRATEGAEIIFNGLNPLYPQWRKLVMPIGENAIAAARAHGALHLFPGNVYNYGRSIPAVVNDDTPFEATTVKGGIRIQLEDYFADQARRHGVRTVVLRAGDFYGGTRPGSWFDLAIAEKIGKGRFTYPAGLDIVHSWAYLPDLAAAFVAIAERRSELSVFESLLFEGHALTGAEMQRYCEAAVGRNLKTAGIPWPLLRLAGLVSPMMREVCEMAYLWKAPHRLDGGRLQALIGSVPVTDPTIAIGRALADMGIEIPASGAEGMAAAA